MEKENTIKKYEGVIFLKVHETQSTEEYNPNESDKVYTPLEDIQRIEGGTIYKRQNVRFGSLPKGIRYIGYFMVGFLAVSGIIGIILSFFF